MKFKILFLLALLTTALQAQHSEGVITYLESVKLEMDIPEEHREQLAGLLPESQTSDRILIFNQAESIYKEKEGQGDDVVEAGSESGGMRIKMVMTRPDIQLYKDLEENKIIQKDEIMGRYFRIAEEMPSFEWKIANESKDILGYTCQKAITSLGEQPVIAWFAPQIPISNGPMMFGQLPGMILELDIDNGQTTIVATSVDLRALDKGEIEAPDKGKKVSREQFDKIEAEKEAEMAEEYGGDGGRMIIRQRR